jgi:hypothetical protein
VIKALVNFPAIPKSTSLFGVVLLFDMIYVLNIHPRDH